MRHCFEVTCDIRDERQPRAVFKKRCAFGPHLRYSDFRCELSEANRVRMKAAQSEVMDHRSDQVLVFDLGPADGFRADLVASFGQAYVVEDRDAVVA